MQQSKIIIDNRERNFDIIDILSKSGADLSFAQLPVGDYILSKRMCVERKTISDFENSIIDNRIFEQLERLSAGFEKPLLIIEGSNSEHKLSKNVVLGTILSIYLDHNIQVINSSGAEETAVMLSKFADREQSVDDNRPRILGRKKAYTTYQWQTLILGSMPGVGPNLAHRLIEHFGTLKGVANADEKQLMKVDKVGKKKAAEIYRIINEEFNPDE